MGKGGKKNEEIGIGFICTVYIILNLEPFLIETNKRKKQTKTNIILGVGACRHRHLHLRPGPWLSGCTILGPSVEGPMDFSDRMLSWFWPVYFGTKFWSDFHAVEVLVPNPDVVSPSGTGFLWIPFLAEPAARKWRLSVDASPPLSDPFCSLSF